MVSQNISIIIPVLNEQDNIRLLVERIHNSVSHISYEIIFIDDHSIDRTKQRILTLAKSYPIFFYTKKGNPGKAQSLIEGFSHAKYSILCMIDGDLQYPPEAIPVMLEKIRNGADVIVTNRKDRATSLSRTFVSNVNRLVIGKLLHNLDFDVQSGLKVFRKEVIARMTLNATPWAFDLEFLLQAKYNGHVIESTDIIFAERRKGNTKINLLTSSFQIGLNALVLKFKRFDKTAAYIYTSLT